MKRYLIPAYGPEIEPVRKAFRLAVELSQQLDSQVEVVMVTPVKNLRETAIEIVIGKEYTKALEKGQKVRLCENALIGFESERTLNEYRSYGILIAFYPNKRLLDKIDSIRDLEHIIVVPWTMESIENWAGTWAPVVIGDSKPQKQIVMDNPVVVEAMKLLTDTINLSSGLNHPSDKAAAVDLFRLLFKNGEKFDPISVRAWALQNGWDPRGATQVSDVAEAINNRRPIRGGSNNHWRKDIIQVLRDRTKPLS